MTNILNITRYAVRNECLTPWVKFLWHIEAVNADIHYKLLPTDCIDVILNLADDMVYETELNKIIAPPFHINGLRSKYSFIHQEKNIRVFGISFYPYGLYPFVHRSLKELQNKVVNLNELSHTLPRKGRQPEGHELRGALGYHLAQNLKKAVTNDSTEKIIAEIENTLIAELSINQNFIEKAQLILDFMTDNDNISIKSFCNERDINIKTFERMFLCLTGYTPKVLRSIKRFQNISNQLTHQRMVPLTNIAYDNSFTDQSHFIKEFTRFSGVAPRAFQSEKATVKENAKYTYL